MTQLSVLRLARAGRIPGFLLALVAVGGFTCPPDLSNGGGEVNNGVYHIEFKSWTWQEESGQHYLCHCVRNLGNNTVRIEWPAVKLAGWARLRQTLFAMGPIPGADVDDEQTEIRYGRETTQVDTKFPHGVNRVSSLSGIGNDGATVVLANTLVAQEQAYPAQPLTQVSEGQVSLPSESVTAGRSIDEIDAIVQDNPDLLQDITMTFTSTANVEDGIVRSITYECNYTVGNANQETSLQMRIDDPRVNEAVFQNDGPIRVTWNELAGDVPFDASGDVEVSASVAQLSTRSSAMSFVSDDGTVLASMPINFLTVQ